MTPKRTFYLMIAIIVLLVAAILGSVYGINSLLDSKSHSLVAIKAKVSAAHNEQVSLVQAKKEIASYNDLYNIAKVVVPENKDQAETVRQIVKLAANSSVNLDSITFPSSSLGSGLVGSSAPRLGTSAVGAANPALSQLTPVANIPGVYDLVITVASSTENTRLATYPQLISFLTALENNRLTALVSSISILPSAQNHNLFSFSLTMNAYIKPGKP